MEAFLRQVLPKLLGDGASYALHVYQGKRDLLSKLDSRLRAYATWLPNDARIVVLVDRDDADCRSLKARLEQAALAAGLRTRSTCTVQPWQAVTRIAIEELEAWFFGEWSAVRRAYPKLPANVPAKAAYRECDTIKGGTWEAFERLLKKAGYFAGGLRKVEAARAIGGVFDPANCRSPSFAALRDALAEAMA